MAKPRGKEKFKADAARRALLDAGQEILRARGVAPGLDRVTLKEAIEISGVPRTTAYRLFDGEGGPLGSFRTALTRDMETAVDEVPTYDLAAELLADGQDVLDRGDPDQMADLLREMIRVAFNQRIAMLVRETRWRAYISTIAAAESISPSRGDVPPDQGQRFVPLFEAVGEIFGIRPIAPMTWLDITNLSGALTDGAALRTLEDDSFVAFGLGRNTAVGEESDEADRPWNGAAVLAMAVFATCCEPDPAAAVSADLSRWIAFG